MDIYLYCIENSFEKLTSLIELINKNVDEYEKYKNDFILYIGNTIHWIVITYDKMDKKNFTFEERNLFSALKAVDNHQKHELNYIEFQEVGNVVIKFPVDFSKLSFDPKGIIWKKILLNETGKYGEQNKKYNYLLCNKPVWNKINEAIIILKKRFF